LLELPTAPRTTTTVIGSHDYLELGRIHDSAELLELPAPRTTTSVTGSHNYLGLGKSPDSAESVELPAALRTTVTGSPRHLELGQTHDSAESLELPAAPCTTAVAGSRGYRELGRIHDSAESLERPSPPCVAGTMSPGDLHAGRADSTVESPADPVLGTETVSSHGKITSDSSAGSTESCVACRRETAVTATPSPTPSRSLLDRLLDEADAFRAGEAVPPVESEAPQREGTRNTVTRVLEQRADAAKRAFSRADALVSLAQAYLRGDRPHRSPIEIVLTIPETGLHEEATDPVQVGEMGDSLLSGQTARRLACDAGVIEVVEDEHGVPLSVGRKRRTIAGALKRALHKRDTMCTFPSCTNRLFLEGHHIKHWADGGETSLTNTSLICSQHHRFVHEYGYTVELGPDQRPRFRDPHGKLITTVPDNAATTELGWARILTANEPLAISADTIAGPWDGTPVDYGRIVGHLASADDLR
jgi:hypothetical protein